MILEGFIKEATQKKEYAVREKSPWLNRKCPPFRKIHIFSQTFILRKRKDPSYVEKSPPFWKIYIYKPQWRRIISLSRKCTWQNWKTLEVCFFFFFVFVFLSKFNAISSMSRNFELWIIGDSKTGRPCFPPLKRTHSSEMNFQSQSLNFNRNVSFSSFELFLKHFAVVSKQHHQREQHREYCAAFPKWLPNWRRIIARLLSCK